MIVALELIDFGIEVVLVPILHSKGPDVRDTSEQFVESSECR